ncbi:hypothetical protein [Desulfocicer vacuolatum]|nr:hypothetical protein [Desulfocicer vacuolatum]
MKYSPNQGGISSFVVGRAGSEYGLPVAVYIKIGKKSPGPLAQGFLCNV